jgi:hypothetical protein
MRSAKAAHGARSRQGGKLPMTELQVNWTGFKLNAKESDLQVRPLAVCLLELTVVHRY